MNFLVKRFIAGSTVEEALDAVHHLNEIGLKAALVFLGEECYSREQATAAAHEIGNLLRLMSAANLDSNVSLKLTQLGFNLDETLAEEHLRHLLEMAAHYDNFIRIDMEGLIYTQRTLDLFYRVFETHKNVGVVIQSYLRRSAADINRLIAIGARVRLCKGAYKEPVSAAFQDKTEVNRSYDALARQLLERGNYPGIATHDDARIQVVIDAAREMSIPHERFEFQMLYGVRRARWRELVAQGYTVRVYVPYGTRWLPYYYRRIRERKENLIFALRSIWGG